MPAFPGCLLLPHDSASARRLPANARWLGSACRMTPTCACWLMPRMLPGCREPAADVVALLDLLLPLLSLLLLFARRRWAAFAGSGA
eukprot:7417668-Lingulodinium_polyedra.AAC.1